MPPAHELTVSRPSVPSLALPRVGVRHWVALAVLGLAALSFLIPSAPTYDPWAWIIWGREIAHLDLSTVDGPSWKPLPVLFTIPFSLFGGLAPDLWVFVARVGTLAGMVMLFRLGRRFAGVPGGVAAVVPYALAPWTVRNAAMGNSEGLLVALALVAIERHLDGRPRAAFLFALGAACCAPRSGRSSASTACGCCGASRLRVASSSSASPRCPPCGFCRSGGGRVTSCAPRTARRTRAATVPRSPRTRSAR